MTWRPIARDQLVVHRTLDEHVVRCDARLPGVDELSPRDPPCSHLDVRVPADDRRALPAELQRHRRQVLRRGTHDDAPDASVARVEDVVEALREQLRRLGDAAVARSRRRARELVEAAPSRHLPLRARARSACRPLRCRPRSPRSSGRAGAAPGSSTVRSRTTTPIGSRTIVERPGLNVSGVGTRSGVIHASSCARVWSMSADHEPDLRRPCLHLGLAEVCCERRQQARLVTLHELLQPDQRVAPTIRRAGPALVERSPRCGDDRRDLRQWRRAEGGGRGAHADIQPLRVRRPQPEDRDVTRSGAGTSCAAAGARTPDGGRACSRRSGSLRRRRSTRA